MNNNSSLSHRNKEPESGTFYVVGTPIGNLSDISSRALNILKNVDIIACEDTRQTKKIIGKYDIKNKLISFNDHNSSKKIPIITHELTSGKSIALVSDAGMPGICDPGENLIKDLRSKGFEIICIPGPSALITALVSSGFQSSKFIFEGFLPKKKIDRNKILLEISKHEKTTVLYESPHRIQKLLKELSIFCGEDREIHISRELTKKFEEHINTDIASAINIFKDKQILGEFTLLIKGKIKTNNYIFEEDLLRQELKDLIEAGLSLSAASKYIAKRYNLSKRSIYNLVK
tara:strand:+ start:18291 stop:19157 length:867 start_codon:yes stop_codon:yes gene_type:complete